MTSLLGQETNRTASEAEVTPTGRAVERRSGSLGFNATAALSATLAGAIALTAGTGVWTSSQGVVRQAEEDGRQRAMTAASRFRRLQNTSAANVARTLDIVLDDQLRALAAATAMLIEAAEADRRPTAYIRDALRQLVARSPLERIDIIAPEGDSYTTATRPLPPNAVGTTFRTLSNARPEGRTAAVDAQHSDGGLTKKAASQAMHRRLAVIVEQALDSETAAQAYGEQGSRRSRTVAQEQTGTIAQVLAHAVELAEDAEWGRAVIEARLQQIIDNTTVQRIEAMGANGPPVYGRSASDADSNERSPEDRRRLRELREGEIQGTRELDGRYDQQRRWVTTAAGSRGNHRLTIITEMATRAGEGSLVESAWQTEADLLAEVNGVEGVWVAIVEAGSVRLAAAAPRPGTGAGSAHNAWESWNGNRESDARLAAGSDTAQSSARIGIWRPRDPRVRSAARIETPGADERRIVVLIENRAEAAGELLQRQASTGIGIALALIAVLGLATSWAMRHWLTNPVGLVAESARALADGNEPPMTLAGLYRRNDEIGSLARGFGQMTEQVLARHDELEDHVESKTQWLREANEKLTATQRRMTREVGLAKTVQEALVPTGERHAGSMSLFSRMTPATDLGGDFVTIETSGENHILVGVCDVSGKGVAAALFMVCAQGALTSAGNRSNEVREIAAETNRRLCKGNDIGMFVTGIIGRLDIRSGELEYVCAGHEPAIMTDGNGTLEKTELTGGIPFGLEPDTAFETRTTRIEKGSTLIIYTDGIPDSCNAEEKDYGEERLRETVKDAGDASPERLVQEIWTSVGMFSTGAPATDDMTCLAIQNKAEPART